MTEWLRRTCDKDNSWKSVKGVMETLIPLFLKLLKNSFLKLFHSEKFKNNITQVSSQSMHEILSLETSLKHSLIRLMLYSSQNYFPSVILWIFTSFRDAILFILFPTWSLERLSRAFWLLLQHSLHYRHWIGDFPACALGPTKRGWGREERRRARGLGDGRTCVWQLTYWPSTTISICHLPASILPSAAPLDRIVQFRKKRRSANIQWKIIQLLKKNEILPFAATWMDLEIIILKWNKSDKDNIAYMWNLKKWYQ